MARLDGKVALVTGAARGIGAETVRGLVAEGARVVATDVLDGEGRALVAGLGDAAVFVPHDVTIPDQWDTAVATAKERFGGLDVLVNNAGIADFGPLADYPRERWDRIIAVNLTSVFLGMQAALPLLRESRRHPSVVNVSSTAGLQGYPALAGYVASKWGVRGLTKSAAIELAPAGIRVNSVHPGAVRTPMTEGLDLTQSHVAMTRVGEPVEIAGLIVYLAGDESTFCTGAEFVADGGELAGLPL
jgi:3alpha(or 20beta)-hydroxysteroid dehydrogenase